MKDLSGINMSNIKDAVSMYIHTTKYARFLPELGRRETFDETVDRVKQMHLDRYPSVAKQIEWAFGLVHRRLVLPSMRSMQFAGQPTLQHNARLYNCCFTHIDRPRVFSEIMYLLMCGCGVGYSIQRQHVAKLPIMKRVDTNLVCHHTVQDSIEGWADAVDALIEGHLNGFYVEFDYKRIRPSGSSISSKGKAPGHVHLKVAMEAMRNILSGVTNRRMTPLECHDIVCYLSQAVMVGGIRSASIIALFSPDDDEMMHCKDVSNFDFSGKNSHRSIANNSVVLDPGCNRETFTRIMNLNQKNFGDPGFVMLENTEYGVNPCGEAVIYPKDDDGNTGFGFCNLVEINAAGCANGFEFQDACRAASIIATLQAGYNEFPYLGATTERIVRKYPLIGVSITGMMDSPWVFTETLLKAGAKLVKDHNEHIAGIIGINASPRCTCIKPSGNSSLELGCVSSGVHPHHAKKYFRRVTANKLDPVAAFFARCNPHMVEEIDDTRVCITFPIETHGLTMGEVSTMDFLKTVCLVHRGWIDNGRRCGQSICNNISSTVTVKDDEWKLVRDFVWNNRNIIGGMTFFPFFADAKVPFCPRQAVATDEDLAKFNSAIEHYRVVDYTQIREEDDLTGLDAACDGEKCNINRAVVNGAIGLRIFLGQVVEPKFESDGLTFEVERQYPNYFTARRVL